MIVRPPVPERPQPNGRRAKAVVEWAEVVFYVFCLALSAATMAIAIVEGSRLFGA